MSRVAEMQSGRQSLFGKRIVVEDIVQKKRNELMTSEDYKSVDTVKQALGSIARLGRAYCVGSVYKFK